MRVEIIPCLKDNYSYLIIDDKNNSACVIDPSEDKPIVDYLKNKNINLKYILNTHHHTDHIGGNKNLKKIFRSVVVGFEEDYNRIPEIDIFLKDNQIWRAENFIAKIIHTPGHTSGHVCYHFFEDQLIFTGDTLFSLGCGRIFEGTHSQMYESLKKIKALPEKTKIYCGHEYTISNSKFCLKYDPTNKKLIKKISDLKKKIDNGFPSIPSTLKDEMECNIFLKAKDQKSFSKLRDLKDNFWVIQLDYILALTILHNNFYTTNTMSYAIIQTGGKQYKVKSGEILKIEKLPDSKPETKIEFKEVLAYGDEKIIELGSPMIDGAKVEANLIKNSKNRTILIFKKRRRHNSRRKNGHRQEFSMVRINKIFSKDGKVLSEAENKVTSVKKVGKETKVEKK